MKVLDLQCQHGHSFEGWFGSENDFQSQLTRGLVQCPICDDAKISKKLSAPRLNLRGGKHNAPTVEKAQEATQENACDSRTLGANSTKANALKSVKNQDSEHPLRSLMQNPEFQAAYMHMVKEVLAKTEDVGNDFAREARKIHYGTHKERGKRGIRGQASRDETLELLDEGIDVMPLPLPKALKGPLQ
jgi:hypothetical protein